MFNCTACSKEVVKPVDKIVFTFETCRVKNYTMDLVINPQINRLSGTVEMDIVNETADTLNELCLRNYAAGYLDELNYGESQIETVKTDENELLEIIVKEDKSVVYVSLNDPLQPQESITLVINYFTGIPNEHYSFSYQDNAKGKLIQLSYCFPVLSMYKDGQWNESPTITSQGESNFQKMTNYNVTLDLPENYVIASVGNEVQNGNVWTINATNVREFAMVACNYMDMETVVTTNGVHVNSYYLKNDNNVGYREYQLSSAKDAIELFSDLVGDYLYDEIDVVQTAYIGGKEFPGLVMIGSDINSNHLDEDIQFSGLCRVVAHEVGHQWFYCAVCNDPYKEAWLDEGMTSYLEEVYMRSGTSSITQATLLDAKNGNSTRISGMSNVEYKDHVKQEKDIYFSEGSIINKAFDEFIMNGSFAESYSTMVYDGGKYFLMELEEEMGKEPFYEMLRDYYSTYQSKEVTTSDFINILRYHNNSSDISAIITKYIR